MNFAKYLPAVALCLALTSCHTSRRAAWMASLPDAMLGCNMSLPGAHDACTAGVDKTYRIFKTQTLDIQGMWDAGVRSFDLRPAATGNCMTIYHDRANTHTTFERTMETLARNLRKHPSEFAVVIFRHESEGDTSDNWASLMGKCLHGLPEGLCIDFREDLTLGELRGHILVLGRKEYEGGIVGGLVDWSDWTPGDNTHPAWIRNAKGQRGILRLQDHYAPKGKEDKQQAITTLLEAAAMRPEWTVNHTSAFPPLGKSYGENAQGVNATTADLIRQMKGKTGILVTDFAGTDEYQGPIYAGDAEAIRDWKVNGKQLVEAVIQQNFRNAPAEGSTSFINVQDFGAKGDGISDDTRALQSAIDYSRDKGGGTLYFPNGTYLLKTLLFDADNRGVASSLHVYSGQTLLFEKGAVLKRGNPDITHMVFTHNDTDATGYEGCRDIQFIGCTFDANASFETSNTSLNLTHGHNIHIIGCSFYGCRSTWHALEINSSRDVSVRNCDFYNNRNSEDIQLDAALKSGNLGQNDKTVCQDIHIRNCRFTCKGNPAIGNHSDAPHHDIHIIGCTYQGDPGNRGFISFVPSTYDYFMEE